VSHFARAACTSYLNGSCHDCQFLRCKFIPSHLFNSYTEDANSFLCLISLRRAAPNVESNFKSSVSCPPSQGHCSQSSVDTMMTTIISLLGCFALGSVAISSFSCCFTPGAKARTSGSDRSLLEGSPALYSYAKIGTTVRKSGIWLLCLKFNILRRLLPWNC
jgi:hypothetical protein